MMPNTLHFSTKNQKMFKTQITELSKNIKQYQIYENDQLLTYQQVIQYWKTSDEFRMFYNSILANIDFEAFFWENRPVNMDTKSAVYEFVLVRSHALAKVKANRKPFLNFFKNAKESVISFQSLGKNALLIVPLPIKEVDGFSHLATFVRDAKAAQIQAFWQKVGFELENRLNKDFIWLNTSGLGVYWVHVRLDERPKYYTYKPYVNYEL
jgi:hypothetical protein